MKQEMKRMRMKKMTKMGIILKKTHDQMRQKCSCSSPITPWISSETRRASGIPSSLMRRSKTSSFSPIFILIPYIKAVNIYHPGHMYGCFDAAKRTVEDVPKQNYCCIDMSYKSRLKTRAGLRSLEISFLTENTPHLSLLTSSSIGILKSVREIISPGEHQAD